MDRNATQEELIQFVYGELSFADTAELYDKLDSDENSLKTLEEYAALKFQLDKILMEPSSGFDEKIMAYSANYS